MGLGAAHDRLGGIASILGGPVQRAATVGRTPPSNKAIGGQLKRLCLAARAARPAGDRPRRFGFYLGWPTRLRFSSVQRAQTGFMRNGFFASCSRRHTTQVTRIRLVGHIGGTTSIGETPNRSKLWSENYGHRRAAHECAAVSPKVTFPFLCND
jgi:hypothetical protein